MERLATETHRMQNRHQNQSRPDVMLRVPPRQWLIGDAATTVRCRSEFDLGAWRVFAGEDVAIWPLTATGGAVAGCLIGTPIDLARTTFVDGPLLLPPGIELEHTGNADRQIVDWLASFAGAFFAVVRQGRSWTLYPSAANSCVYDTRTGRVGTTAAAIPASPAAQATHAAISRGVVVLPETVTVGQPFRVVVRVRAPRGSTIDFPQAPDSGTAVEALDPVDVVPSPDTTVTEQTATYRLAAWDVGARALRFADVVVRDGDEEHAVVRREKRHAGDAPQHARQERAEGEGASPSLGLAGQAGGHEIVLDPALGLEPIPGAFLC